MHITNTNIVTLLISIVSIIFIYSVKHFINEKYASKMIAPIPVDLIVVTHSFWSPPLQLWS